MYAHYTFCPLIFLLNKINEFSIASLFHPKTKQHERIKISSILQLFHPLLIFYPLIKRNLKVLMTSCFSKSAYFLPL